MTILLNYVVKKKNIKNGNNDCSYNHVEDNIN